MPKTPKLSACGCCEAVPPLSPPSNRPGLSALSYRLGTYATFLRHMLSQLHSQTIPDGPNQGTRPLAALTTRSTDDPAIALLDAWATVADVLSFYQERIANEGYLRTATERRSVLELARAIGYELSPGVAANTFLAFTVEDAPGAPRRATVPQGTKVQSVPVQGKLPQTFETIEGIQARAEWNALRPRLTRPQTLKIGSSIDQVYLKGTTTNLKPGDLLLLVDTSNQTQPLVVRHIGLETLLNRTRIDFSDKPAPLASFVPPNLSPGQLPAPPVPLTWDNVNKYVQQVSLDESQLQALLAMNSWAVSDLLAVINNPPAPTSPPDPGVFAFRTRVGFFGNNAPRYESLLAPNGQRLGNSGKYIYPNNWDTKGWDIWTDSLTGKDYSDADVFLERSLQGVIPNSWAVFETPGPTHTPFSISSITAQSLAGFGIGAKVTGMKLVQPGGASLTVRSPDFQVRKTTAYVQSEQLQLADLPIDDDILAGATDLMLDGMVIGLHVGQPLILSGTRADANGVVASEVVILHDITHDGGFTNLTFKNALANSYLRNTVTLNANVARATHGETVHEGLGSGDASQANQSFALKRRPLTYVSAPTPSGAESTLTVRVNDLLWQEVPSLYGRGARDEDYVARLDDDGTTTLTFGDGVAGARLPSGQTNIAAAYRTGIGLDGDVDAGSLTLLQTRPLGIRGVTNPLAAGGAAGPQDLAHARVNAPLTVLTLDRIVSLEDYEDFARAFAGIGKAQAVALWNGEMRLVHITVAGANGDTVDPSSALYNSLVAAIDAARDPVQQVRVTSYQLLLFNLKAGVLVDEPRYVAGEVLAAVGSALQAAFSFGNRAFAQAVSAAEVVTVIQAVPGVIATDLSQLYLATDTNGPNQSEPLPFVTAAPAQWQNGVIQPARLLLLNPVGVTLTEVKP